MAIAQREGVGGSLVGRISGRRRLIAEATELLETFGLAEARDKMTREMPYGQQRLLEIALAFALKPAVLLLDVQAAEL